MKNYKSDLDIIDMKNDAVNLASTEEEQPVTEEDEL